VAGNLSSIYQTLLALYNLAEDRFYYPGEIANVFLDKMERTIGAKVASHLAGISRALLGPPAANTAPTTAAILAHILAAKLAKAPSAQVRALGAPPLGAPLVQALLRRIVERKFEIRSEARSAAGEAAAEEEAHEDLLLYLCGEQASHPRRPYP